MISLSFSTAELNPDIEVKQRSAQRQMVELLERLQNVPKYHTLTQNDRQRLKKEGYAPDLMDNLVVITQRSGGPTDASTDKVMVGFTYAAFDPALYASDEIRQHFEHISLGCCCYCESFLTPTNSGQIYHYRPVELLDEHSHVAHSTLHQCSPYFALAYEQSNLLYVCPECGANHKAGLFPVAGVRFPNIALEEERALLINPYQEQPRDFIRFNPLNGQAYAFDQVCAFFAATKQWSKEHVANVLWQSPAFIPGQRNASGELLTDEGIEHSFQAWLPDSAFVSRGQVTIDTLGLNRTALVLARLAVLKQCRTDFSDQADDFVPPLFADQVESMAYRSLVIDAFTTWYWKQKQVGRTNAAEADVGSKEAVEPDSSDQSGEVTEHKSEPLSDTSKLVSLPVQTPALATHEATFPLWLRSCLVYLVVESELEQANRRRLVCLSSQDRFYGQKSKEKCVFLPVNWQKDSHNVIKVRSHRNIWEASFSELADSRPQELVNLFANNDVWVEGDYPALIAQ